MKKVVVVSASWCPSCGPYKAALDRASIPYMHVDADDPENLAFMQKMNIRSLPSTCVYDGEELLGVVAGNNVKKVEELLAQ